MVFIIQRPLICETALRPDLSKTMITHDAEYVPEAMATLQGRGVMSKAMTVMLPKIITDLEEIRSFVKSTFNCAILWLE